MLLVGTILGGWSAPLLAQATTPPATPAPTQPPAATPAPIVAASAVIRSISVRGNQRLEPPTIISYAGLAPGQTYTAATLDQALKDLYATELFADVVITGAETGAIVITVRESPVINRIVLEGNKRLKSDKITPEIKLAPRQIFTRSKVRADVERIVELYKRDGRYGARVEPKIVQLDQNRVDLVFEIYEGDKSKIRRINVIGNQAFGDERLRKEMYSRQAGGLLGFLKSNDSYDPDRLAADQQKLRAFYLTEGYADFRVVSALAELTPDRRDFIITYVIEEGPRYRLGTVEAESALRDLGPDKVKQIANLKPGTWFNAKAVEDAVTGLSEVAGALGYAFADINPAYERVADKRVMNITIRVGDTPRVYVERIDINGNTVTRDKVLRREFRVNEGDAFNAIKVKRSQDRIQSLGYFQENLEIKQTEGSGPDRVVLSADVEEKATGQLQFSGGYSSYERFILSLSVQQNNFRGMGQTLGAGVDWSRYSKSVQLSFADPHLFDKQILFGGQLFRRDYNSFNFINGERNRTYGQVSTGGGLRLGFPLNEYTNLGLRYALVMDNITLDQEHLFHRSGRHRPAGSGVRSAQGRQLFVRRARRPHHFHDRPFGPVRQHQRRSRDPRAADCAVAGLRGPRRRRPLSSQPGQRHQVLWLRRRLGALGARRGRLHPPVQQGPQRQIPTRSGLQTNSSARRRRFAGSTSAGSGRASCAPPMSRPETLLKAARAGSATRSAAALITWRGPSLRFRSAPRSATLASGRAPTSRPARCSASSRRCSGISRASARRRRPTPPAPSTCWNRDSRLTTARPATPSLRATRNSSSATRPGPGSRSGSASTGLRRSGRFASTSRGRSSSRTATTPNSSTST